MNLDPAGNERDGSLVRGVVFACVFAIPFWVMVAIILWRLR